MAAPGVEVAVPHGVFVFAPGTPQGRPGVPKDWVLDPVAPASVRLWRVAGSAADALAIGAGGGVSTKFAVPAVKEGSKPGEWGLWVGIDAVGVTDPGTAAIKAELLGPDNMMLVRSVLRVNDTVAVPQEKRNRVTSVTGEQPGAPFAYALDGDPQTAWHSKYAGGDIPHPHTIVWEFASPAQVRGVRYLPRADGGNGTITKWKLDWTNDGETWHPAIEGSWDYPEGKNKEQQAMMLKEEKVLALRFSSVEAGGGPWASAAEIGVIGQVPADTPVAAKPPAPRSLWLQVPGLEMDKLVGKEVTLKIAHADGKPVVLSKVSAYLLHRSPTEALLGKANGNNGPDKIAAGGLGFDALTEHGHRVFTLMTVRAGTPAAKAGLAQGDVVTAINGQALAPANLWAGWEWFHQSHESMLGRAIESAATRANRVKLSVVRARDGQQAEIDLELSGRPLLGEGFPFDDAASVAMYRDMIDYLCNKQKENGSWNDNQIHTALSGLALLGSRDHKHLSRIRRAVEWCLAKSPDPTKEKGLCYWGMGHQGVFLAEYHLATGDPLVLPWIQSAMQWIPTGVHRTKWGYLGLGHGPEGLPYEEKGLIAPAVHLAMFDALGRQCGFTSEFWDKLWPYFNDTWSDLETGGHGGLGYNASYRDTEEYWFRSGLFSAALNVMGERPDMQSGMTRIMRARHPWLRNSHAYGEPGSAWGLMGLASVAPQRFREVMAEYRWSFALAWEPGYGLRFTTPSMGAPYMGEEELINPAYAAVMSARHRGLWLTGARDRGWLKTPGVPLPAATSTIKPRMIFAGIGDVDEDVAKTTTPAALAGMPVVRPAARTTYPVNLVVDFPGQQSIQGVALQFAAAGRMPGRITIRQGLPGGGWSDPLGGFALASPLGMVDFPVDPPVTARRILLELDGPAGAEPGIEAIKVIPVDPGSGG